MLNVAPSTQVVGHRFCETDALPRPEARILIPNHSAAKNVLVYMYMAYRLVHINLRRDGRARVGDRLVLVAAGGIDTPDDAWERIRAGATLLQGYTGFIYGGPLWPHRVHCGLARRAHQAGFASVQDAVGTSALAASPQRVRALRAQHVKARGRAGTAEEVD